MLSGRRSTRSRFASSSLCFPAARPAAVPSGAAGPAGRSRDTARRGVLDRVPELRPVEPRAVHHPVRERAKGPGGQSRATPSRQDPAGHLRATLRAAERAQADLPADHPSDKTAQPAPVSRSQRSRQLSTMSAPRRRPGRPRATAGWQGRQPLHDVTGVGWDPRGQQTSVPSASSGCGEPARAPAGATAGTSSTMARACTGPLRRALAANPAGPASLSAPALVDPVRTCARRVPPCAQTQPAPTTTDLRPTQSPFRCAHASRRRRNQYRPASRRLTAR